MITTEGSNRAPLRVPVADASGEVVKTRFLGNILYIGRDFDAEFNIVRSNNREKGSSSHTMQRL